MSRILRVPDGLTKAPYHQSFIKLNGCTVVDSCIHTEGSKKGSMFLEEPILLIVIHGIYKINYGHQEYLVKKDEMVLLKKSIVIEYHKSGDPENNNRFEYMIFFLKDQFFNDFLKKTGLKLVRTEETEPVTIKKVSRHLLGFMQSIKPYFDDPELMEPQLVHLKMTELFYNLAQTDKSILRQLIQLKHPVRSTIKEVMESNYLNPVSLDDLAYLSGRSLSTFKREFKEVYNTTPAKWIRKHRLQKARELLTGTGMSVTEVCYQAGFENVAHFSRIFKEQFGASPSSV